MDKWPGWDGWTPGGIRIRGPVKGGGSGDFATAGWIKGSLAMDLRPRVTFWGAPLPGDVCDFAWVVTHVPTGYAMCGIDAPPAMAQSLVDDLSRLTDWSLITVESAVFMDARIRAFFSEHPGIFFSPSDTLGPWDSAL
ncbi:MAG: hypothetical protein ACK4TC_04990 [Sphingomonas pseudosanguinis]|uniref:hypothetical protein n=1 Tax=Sphingomonas pseudosanguinis TaxID=413712 RepID=UPI00391BCE18